MDLGQLEAAAARFPGDALRGSVCGLVGRNVQELGRGLQKPAVEVEWVHLQACVHREPGDTNLFGNRVFADANKGRILT